MSNIQQTLIILKPDTIARGLIGEIVSRFEKAGLHLTAMKMVKPTDELLQDHYEGIGKLGTRKGENVLNEVKDLMKVTPVIAMVREGVEAVSFVRKLVGPTEPKSAQPGTIRGDFAHMSYGYVDTNADANLFNLVHASADEGEASQEIPLWFNEDEICHFSPLHARFTR